MKNLTCFVVCTSLAVQIYIVSQFCTKVSQSSDISPNIGVYFFWKGLFFSWHNASRLYVHFFSPELSYSPHKDRWVGRLRHESFVYFSSYYTVFILYSSFSLATVSFVFFFSGAWIRGQTGPTLYHNIM